MIRLKSFNIAFFACICFLMSTSCRKSDENNGQGNTNYSVKILAAQFDPATITMIPGATITWTNVDTDMHSVISDDATSFTSGPQSIGGTFSFTPTVTGTYTYHCGIHPAVKGTLNVVTR